MAAGKSTQHGLIILGNSGVGKSFLANILLGKDVFKHEFSARSVTHRTEFQEIKFENYRYAIFNIPGLIEADQTRVDVNKHEIDRAFQQRPNSLIIYVFGQQNGRIRDEDAVAFNAINAAYPLKIESLLIVVNGLPANRPPNYEGEVMLMLQDITQFMILPKRVCFVNHIDSDKIHERQSIKNQLLNAIVELTPTEHVKVHDIQLKIDEVVILKEQIRSMTKEFEANRRFFETEIREQQRRYDQVVANQKNENDNFHRIIERQAQDAKDIQLSQAKQMEETKKQYETQLSIMQKQMEKMQEKHENLNEKMRSGNNRDDWLSQKALADSAQAQRDLEIKITKLQEEKQSELEKQKKKSSVSLHSDQSAPLGLHS
ncbi:unnamed protein product [Rotaria sp. Silwood2]|nr:unnamed protein product [Rotaria sp. Silwood2]CAF4573046.1 unnamed protein product [Rotaria sp. Silwood2]